ncbi:MAG: hypothetical protein J5886_00175, partial [Bacteroidales bacterium]|nr:hypothetical protein [Bacteroidales bacterium]
MKNLTYIIVIIGIWIPIGIEAQTKRDTSIVIKESIISERKGSGNGGAGSIVIPADMIKNAPALLGEPDILKTIQLLPGIQ